MPDIHDEPTITAATWPCDPPDLRPDLPPTNFGDYELLGELGRGGMGVVFRARERELNRLVAIKMLLPGSLANESDLQRFRVEAEAAARLQHPNIVSVHRVGELDGRHYYSMDYVAGQTLTQRLANGPLPGRVGARYLIAIARGIQHAHEHGILHRDLKPANILLDADDQPRVTDFGLAKQFNVDCGNTRTGSVLGTPSYMSPEQAAGRRDVGPACDIYGLGALFYELLTGRPPFRAETPLDTLLQVMDREPVPPRLLNPKIDHDLEKICLKCLCKQPNDRYASAEELALDLERFLDGEPIQARSLNVMDRLAHVLRRSQFDQEFRGYGNLLLFFAVIVFAVHATKQVCLFYQRPPLVVFAIGIFQFIFMFLVFWAYRRHRILPQSVAERQLWAVWLGYIFSCILTSVLVKTQFGLESAYHMTEYPYLAVMAGMAFFVLGSSYWGGCYGIALAFFALSGVMVLDMRWAVLEYGVFWGIVLTLIGFRLRQLGGDAEQSAESASTRSTRSLS